MAYKRIFRNDANMNVANVEDDEDVIDLLEVARAILKHLKLINPYPNKLLKQLLVIIL